MIELTTSQGDDGHLQLTQLFIDNRGISTQTTAELTIEIIFFQLPVFSCTFLDKQSDCLITQHPYANIRQIEMILLQLAESGHRRLLQHLLQHRR